MRSGGELQSDSEGGTDGLYENDGDGIGWDGDCDELGDDEGICIG